MYLPLSTWAGTLDVSVAPSYACRYLAADDITHWLGRISSSVSGSDPTFQPASRHDSAVCERNLLTLSKSIAPRTPFMSHGVASITLDQDTENRAAKRRKGEFSWYD